MTKEGSFAGDFGTPEQEIPATGLPGVDWETCMTMNDTWGFNKDDQQLEVDAKTLIRKLIDIASQGRQLPAERRADGRRADSRAERRAPGGRSGKWMKVNGEAIYGTTASPFKKLAWGRCHAEAGQSSTSTSSTGRKDGKLVVPGLKNKVEKAYLLADASRAPWRAHQPKARS